MKRMFNISVGSSRINSGFGIGMDNRANKQNKHHTIYSVCLMDYEH